MSAIFSTTKNFINTNLNCISALKEFISAFVYGLVEMEMDWQLEKIGRFFFSSHVIMSRKNQ